MTIKLPEGYSDPSSKYFVPEEFRKYYETAKPVTRSEQPGLIDRYSVHAVASSLTGEEAELFQALELRNTGADIPPYLVEKIKEFLPTFQERVKALAEESPIYEAKHFSYMNQAHRAWLKHQEWLDKDRKAREQSVCPKCGVETYRDQLNKLTKRSLTFQDLNVYLETPGEFYSCAKCYRVALDILTSRDASERIQKKTRRDLVTEALAV